MWQLKIPNATTDSVDDRSSESGMVAARCIRELEGRRACHGRNIGRAPTDMQRIAGAISVGRLLLPSRAPVRKRCRSLVAARAGAPWADS